MRDYYRTLRVSDRASADEIKRVYRDPARQFHPDVCGDARRARVSRREGSVRHARGPGPAAGGTTSRRPAPGGCRVSPIARAALVLRRDRPGTPVRRRAHRPDAGVLLRTGGLHSCRYRPKFSGTSEAFRGTRVPFDVPVRFVCGECGGRGESWMEACLQCAGSGQSTGTTPRQLLVPRGPQRHAISLQRAAPLASPMVVEVRDLDPEPPGRCGKCVSAAACLYA